MGQSEANNPEVKAFRDANAKMHEAMNVPLRGDADCIFVLSMIPHHQGAIDMARVELQYGKDPELRKLAKNIIAAQDMLFQFSEFGFHRLQRVLLGSRSTTYPSLQKYTAPESRRFPKANVTLRKLSA